MYNIDIHYSSTAKEFRFPQKQFQLLNSGRVPEQNLLYFVQMQARHRATSG